MFMVSLGEEVGEETTGLVCFYSPVSEPVLGRHAWLGVTQISGDGSDQSEIESSGNFHTYIFGTRVGNTQKLVSAQIFD